MSDDEGAKVGGTLVVVGSVDVDHLDTASGYLTQTWALTRNFARTLVNIRGGADFAEAVTLRADAAAEIPTVANGGLSEDGLVYTIRLRPGVRWNTRPARAVTATDFVRGIKRLANPAQPSGALSFYRDTIEGMAGFHAAFQRVDSASATELAEFQENTEIAGARAIDDVTIVFRLTRPASDFLRLLSLQFTAAAPVEYNSYLPDSVEFRQNTISNGPYQVTEYRPNEEIRLVRNTTWSAESDPIRRQYVDAISVRFGEHSPEAVQKMIEKGAADLSWDQRIPTSRIPQLVTQRDPNLLIADESMSSPYLSLNFRSPNNGGALLDVRVRQAIALAIDKAAIARVYGGATVCAPLHQVIPPGGFGYRKHEPYATDGDHGDPAASRKLLADAGHPDGIRLRFPYRTSSSYPKVARIIADNLASCGILVDLIDDPDLRYYGKILHTPTDGASGAWDIAIPAWVPDWYGNNGRTSIVPLFDGRAAGANSPNYGGYDNPAVNAEIDRALQAVDETDAAEHWHAADRLIMADVAMVPLLTQRYPIYHSSRARNTRYLPVVQVFEYNQIWLDDKGAGRADAAAR